jgi:small conductance mechanosensitive channel
MDQWLNSLEAVDWRTLIAVWGMRLLGAMVVLLVGLWVIRVIANTAQRALDRAGVDSMLSGFLRNIAYAALMVVILVMSLGTLGVQTTSLLAVLGAAGLAIGLALQGSLSNIAAGIMLITLRPFKSGDFVSIAGQEGSVDQVKVFQTVLRTPDNRVVTLPNSQITSAPIINFTGQPQRRADIVVGIGYEQDVARARALLLGIVASHPKVLDEPAPDVLASNLGESSVDLTLRAWISTPDYVETRSELIEIIHGEMGKAGINIPFPQRDVHLTLPPDLVEALSRLARAEVGAPASVIRPGPESERISEG